jgi:hypothetical protein
MIIIIGFFEPLIKFFKSTKPTEVKEEEVYSLNDDERKVALLCSN